MVPVAAVCGAKLEQSDSSEAPAAAKLYICIVSFSRQPERTVQSDAKAMKVSED